MGQMFQEPDPVTTSELVTENVGGNTFAFVKETTNGSTNISNLQTIEKEDGEKTFTTAAILNYDQTKDLVTQNPGLMTVDSLNLGSSYSVELNEDQSIKKITEVKPEKVKVNQPVTDLGKLESDLTKGLITKEDYDTKKAIILGGLSEKDKFASENTISKRFQDNLQIKNLSNIIPIVRAAIATANVDTMAADLDLVFAVGKAFDPTSVVRGSEQVTIQKAASLPEQFKGIIRYVNGKGRLTPVQKADLINQVISRYKVHLDSGINYFEGEKSILKTRELNEKVLIMPSLIDPREINAIKNISADGQVVPFQITVNYPSVSGNDDSAYQELPSGSLYFGPDGQLRRKK
jgi:hypothetical protein